MTTMVDSKIGKTFQRSVGRAKEKLLQNLGKVDRTADEILDEQIANFNKQQGAASRLQKELNNYIRCIRACAAASRSLLESVGEVYEPEWGGKELLTVNSQSVELLWNDFAHRLAEQVLIPLNTYQGQFPEMKKKIEKRARKLIDFDGERHALQALQANPRRAEAKLAKQRESLEAAKRTYEVLNSELHEELPNLYNSRIIFLVSAMSTLFASENIFHSESSKVFTELEGIVERLSKESAKGNLNFKLPSHAIMNHTGVESPKDEKGGKANPESPSSKTSSNSNPSSPVTPCRPTSLKMPSSTPTSEHSSITNGDNKGEGSNHVTTNGTGTPTQPSSHTNTEHTPTPNGTDTATPVATDCKGTSQLVNGGTDASGEETSASQVPPLTPSSETGNAHSLHNGLDHDNSRSNSTTTSATTTPTTDRPDTTTPNALDANNNDVATLLSTVKKEALEKVDKVDDAVGGSAEQSKELNGHVSSEGSPKSPETVDCKGDDVDDAHVKGADDASPDATATAPARAANKSSSGNLELKSNGELTDAKESSKKDSPSDGDSKEPGILYRVKATYRYQKEDADELSFDAGEIIRVVEYDEPEEQEEGWLMGIKENGEKGLFPANFTRPI